MPGAVKFFVIRLRVFDIGTRRDARLAPLRPQPVPERFAVISFVRHGGAVSQRAGERRGRGVIADVPRRQEKRRCQASPRVDHHMDLCVEPSPGASNGPFPGAPAAMGMLVNLAMGAVKVMHLRALRADQQLFQKPGQPRAGEPVKKLKHREPLAELRGQSPPGDTIAQDIPQGVEMGIQRSPPPATSVPGNVSGLESLELIFLAARGAAPA